MLIVQKFGGSSLKDFERLRRVAERCLARRRREEELVVVVSVTVAPAELEKALAVLHKTLILPQYEEV